MFNKWKILIDVTLTLTQLYKNGYNVNKCKPILFSCSGDWIDHRMSGSTYFDFNIKVAMNTLNKSKATNVGWIMKWWFRSTGNDDHNSNIDFALDDCGKRATLWISMRESKPNAFYWGSSEARPPLYVTSCPTTGYWISSIGILKQKLSGIFGWILNFPPSTWRSLKFSGFSGDIWISRHLHAEEVWISCQLCRCVHPQG